MKIKDGRLSLSKFKQQLTETWEVFLFFLVNCISYFLLT